MSARIEVTMTDEQARRVMDNERQAWEKNTEAVKKLGSQVSKNERTQIRAANAIIKKQRSAKQVLDDNIKALQAYGATGREAAVKSATAIGRLKTAYKEQEAAAVEAARKGTDAYKEQQRQVMRGVETTKRLKEANQTLDQKYRELRTSIRDAMRAGKIGADEARTAIKQLNEEQKKAKTTNPFGGKAVANIAQYAAGVGSVATAIRGVRAAYRLVQEEIDKGKSETEKLERSRGNIAQISGPENFQSRLATADAAAAKFGIDRSATAKALFDITSNRRLNETDKETKKSFQTAVEFDRVVPAEVAATFIGEFRKVFDRENLTARESVNLGLSAAANSAFNIQQLQPQLQTAGQGSLNLPGVTSSDVAALTASIAVITKERTGRTVQALQANFGAELIKQQDALKKARIDFENAKTETERAAITERGTAAADAVKLLSSDLIPIIEGLSKEENKGLRESIIGDNKKLLTNFQTAVSILSQVKAVDKNIERDVSRSGTDSDLLATKNRLLESDKIINAGIEVKKSEIARDISAEKFGSERGNKIQTDSNRLATQLNQDGSNIAQRGLATAGQVISQTGDFIAEERVLTTFLKSIFGDGVDLKQRLANGQSAQGQQPTETEKRQTELLKTMATNSGKQARAAEKTAAAITEAQTEGVE